MAFNYLRVNSKRVGLEHDIDSYDLNVQVMSPGHGSDSPDLGVAFFVAMLSGIVNKPLAGGMVVLGEMTIHGVLGRVEYLSDRLRVAMDAGASKVLIPTVNASDFGSIPPELLEKIRVEFYSEPMQAVFKALATEQG